MPVDPVILDALGLDGDSAKQASYGGSGFSCTYRLTGLKDGKQVDYFVKTGSGKDAEVMFRGEHASLNAIHAAVPNFCPASHGHGQLADSPDQFFLATDFLHLGAREQQQQQQQQQQHQTTATGSGSGQSLAHKLAQMHTTPAPVPEGHDKPMFGFPVPTCCGSTEQDNTWRESWADFYANHRIRAIGKACAARANGGNAELERALDTVAATVVPRLVGDQTVRGIVPVVVHGDLWSGNKGRGLIAGQGGVEEVVYDPSAVYGHSEYELGIMHMFGGFGSTFWSEYNRLVPKAEPKEEWEDRVALYELYHHLNHYAMFGGGYRNGAMSIMARLISKYG